MNGFGEVQAEETKSTAHHQPEYMSMVECGTSSTIGWPALGSQSCLPLHTDIDAAMREQVEASLSCFSCKSDARYALGVEEKRLICGCEYA